MKKKLLFTLKLIFHFELFLIRQRLYDYQNRPPLSLGMPRHIQPGVSPSDFDVH